MIVLFLLNKLIERNLQQHSVHNEQSLCYLHVMPVFVTK